MMFVQLQLAAQHAPLQHRHVLATAAAARGDASMAAPTASPCRPVSSAARIPPVPTSPAPTSPSPVTAGSFRSHSASTTCPEVSLGGRSLAWELKGGSPLDAADGWGLGAPTAPLVLRVIPGPQAVGRCCTLSSRTSLPHQQMDCSPAASTGTSPASTPVGSPASRSRKPGAVIESFVNHAPGVFSGTFSGRWQGSHVCVPGAAACTYTGVGG